MNGATPTVNLTFAAQGSLNVLVTDSNDTAVAGASVSISASNGNVSDNLSATTGANGRVVVEHVLAGSIAVSATQGGLSGSASTTLAADQVSDVTVKLQPTATITGTIFLPNGQSPATSGSLRVRQDNVYPYAEFVFNLATATDGVYRFERLPLGTYTLRVYDAKGQFRAIARDIGLETNNEVETRDLSFVGLGTVAGRVVNPDGSSASGIGVVVQSLVSDFGLTRYASADGAGNYEALNVPVGTVVATAQTGALIGERRSRLAQDGETLVLDILLENNAISLPTTLYDANAGPYDVQQNGAMHDGHTSVFRGDYASNVGASQLTITRNGTPEAFAGASFGTFEQQRREVVIRQENVNGVAVTRKVFVPATGYFARYLDVLTNTSSEPVTVDVKLTTNYRAPYCCSVNLVTTSSGDRLATVADRWVVLDDSYDQDPYESYQGPSTAVVFGDANGLDAPDEVGVVLNNPGRLMTTWQQVTIPAGATVAYLSFVSQQANQNAARRTAERLVQLPPEALDGLSSTELAAIVNFVTPADGVGTVTPLPVLTGVVTGTVFEGDGVTLASNATVTYQSDSPFFNRRINVAANELGAFEVRGLASGQLPVPVDGFKLQARHANNSVTSPMVPGTFAAGETAATRDVTFTGFGVIDVTATRRDGTPIAGMYVYVNSGPQGGGNYTNAEGRVVFGGMRPGTYQLYGETSHQYGTGARLETTPLTLVAGQHQVVAYQLEPTGTLTITVLDGDGNPAPNTYVNVYSTARNFSRGSNTDALGVVSHDQMPVGSYVVYGSEPLSGYQSQVTADVAADTANAVTLRFVALGSVTVQVLRSSGAAAAGVYVYMQSSGFYADSRTNANGLVTFSNVPVGVPLTLNAYLESNSNLRVATPYTQVSRDAATTSVTLPPYGAITGLNTTATGGLVANRCQVYVSGTNYSSNACTNALGVYRLDGVPAGVPLTMTVYDNNYNYQKRYQVQLGADGEELTKDVAQPAIGTALLTVRQGDGTPLANVRIEYNHETQGYFSYRGNTNASGQFTITNVVEGAFTIRIRNSSNTFTLAQRDLAMLASGHGVTVPYDITVNTFTGTVSGTVTLKDGVTPTTGVTVELRVASDNGLLTSTSAAANGAFSFANVTMPDGGFSLQASWQRDSQVRATPQLVQLTAGGQTQTTTVVMPLVMGTVEGQVTSGPDRTPVSGVQMYLYSSPNYGYINGVVTDADGRYAFSQVMSEGFNLRLNLQGVRGGQLRADGRSLDPVTHRATVDFVVEELVGRVSGTLTAMDGTTPISYASVELMAPCGAGDECDIGEYVYRTSFSVNSAGAYNLAAVAISDGSVFRVHSPSRYEIRHDVPVAFAQAGEQLVFNMAVPFSVVSGTVTFSNGSPVQNPNVFGTSSNGTTQSTINDSQGRYRIYSMPAGDFTLTANDNNSGLSSTVEASLASADEVKVIDLVMPPSNDIVVTALGPDGTQLFNRYFCVAVQSARLSYYRDECDDSATGSITMANVPLGVIHAQAYYYDNVLRQDQYASVVADVAASPTPFPVQVSYATATRSNLQVTVLNADGTATSDNGWVYVYPFGAPGPLGYDDIYKDMDVEGKAAFTSLPPGPARVEVEYLQPVARRLRSRGRTARADAGRDDAADTAPRDRRLHRVRPDRRRRVHLYDRLGRRARHVQRGCLLVGLLLEHGGGDQRRLRLLPVHGEAGTVGSRGAVRALVQRRLGHHVPQDLLADGRRLRAVLRHVHQHPAVRARHRGALLPAVLRHG